MYYIMLPCVTWCYLERLGSVMLPCVTRCYLERLCSVIASSNGVGCSKDRCACVECCLDACLGDGDGLLFHGLVDGRLVVLFHLVKLINTTHTLGGGEKGEGEGEERGRGRGGGR